MHNNSGRNPHYSCISTLDKTTLAVASLFSRTIIYFTEPEEALSVQFSKLVPISMTLECGQSGSEFGIQQAKKLIESCLSMEFFGASYLASSRCEHIPDFRSFRSLPGSSFSFGSIPSDDAELVFRGDLEDFNFVRCPKELFWGKSESLSPGVVWFQRGKRSRGGAFYLR